MKSSEQAGIPIPPKTRRLMIRFLSNYSKGRHGGLSAYRPAERPSPTMTAEALLCKRLLNFDVPESMSEEACEFIIGELPDNSQVNNLYFWYYANLALHEEQKAFDSQKKNWSKWNRSLTKKILSMQQKTGKKSGSFPADTLWGPYGGRLYSTALATLCLEVYYRYELPSKSGIRSAIGHSR